MPSSGIHKGTILVADDDEALRDIYVQMLRKEKFQVLVAGDGVEALELLKNSSVDVALIDVMMPRHNGFDVCRIARSRPESRFIPIVLVTGLRDAEDHARGVQAGADDFISKPIQNDELIARLKHLVKMKRMSDELEHFESVLFSLALKVQAREPGTEGHCERVARYSAALGQRLGLSVRERNALCDAGFLHDIGMISIPESVLLKPGPLNEEERRQLEAHPEMGEQICAPVQSFADALPIIRGHHERLDGGGYPDHLKGNEVPVTVRILQVVDIYDSLVSARPHRPALLPEVAFETIRGEVRKGWWDGTVVDELECLLKDSAAHREIRPPRKAWAAPAWRQTG